MGWTRTVKPENQDSVVARAGLVGVVDGATPISGSPGASAATSGFASLLTQCLNSVVRSPDLAPERVAEALWVAQGSTQEGCGVTATIAVAVWGANDLSVVVCGDSPVWVFFRDGTTERVVDPAFAERESTYLGAVQECLNQGDSPEDAYASILPDLRQARADRNTPPGVWVPSDTVSPQELLPHLHHVVFPVEEISAIVAVTDGTETMLQVTGTRPSALPYMEPGELNNLYEQADLLQLQDGDKTRFLRLSDRDDASVARVRFQ